MKSNRRKELDALAKLAKKIGAKSRTLSDEKFDFYRKCKEENKLLLCKWHNVETEISQLYDGEMAGISILAEIDKKTPDISHVCVFNKKSRRLIAFPSSTKSLNEWKLEMDLRTSEKYI